MSEGQLCAKCHQPIEGRPLFCPHCGERARDDLFTAIAMPAVDIDALEQAKKDAPPAEAFLPPKEKGEDKLELDAEVVRDVSEKRQRSRVGFGEGEKEARTELYRRRPLARRSAAPVLLLLGLVLVGAAAFFLVGGSVSSPLASLFSSSAPSNDSGDHPGKRAQDDDGKQETATGRTVGPLSIRRGHGNLTEQEAVALVNQMLGQGAPAALAHQALKKRERFEPDQPSAKERAAIARRAREHRRDKAAQAALALSLADKSPKRALKILRKMHGKPSAAARYAKARALIAQGRTAAALTSLNHIPASYLPGQSTLVQVLAGGGRCQEAQPAAERLARDGGIAGSLLWMRYLVLCRSQPKEAERVANALLSLPKLADADRARVVATAALLRLWQGDLVAATDLCGQASKLDKALPTVRRAMARCALANGVLNQRMVLPPPRPNIDTDHTVVAAQLLLAGRKLPGSDRAAPRWWKGMAMVRAVDVSKRSSNQMALGAVAGALLAPRWDGTNAVPVTALELAQLAKLAPGKHAGFAEGLAQALVALSPTSGVGEARAVFGAIATRGRGESVQKATLKSVRDAPLTRFLLATSPSLTAQKAKFLVRLVGDSQVGPAAWHAMAQVGQGRRDKAFRRLTSKLSASMPRHPDVVAARLLLAAKK